MPDAAIKSSHQPPGIANVLLVNAKEITLNLAVNGTRSNIMIAQNPTFESAKHTGTIL